MPAPHLGQQSPKQSFPKARLPRHVEVAAGAKHTSAHTPSAQAGARAQENR